MARQGQEKLGVEVGVRLVLLFAELFCRICGVKFSTPRDCSVRVVGT